MVSSILRRSIWSFTFDSDKIKCGMCCAPDRTGTKTQIGSGSSYSKVSRTNTAAATTAPATAMDNGNGQNRSSTTINYKVVGIQTNEARVCTICITRTNLWIETISGYHLQRLVRNSVCEKWHRKKKNSSSNNKSSQQQVNKPSTEQWWSGEKKVRSSKHLNDTYN